MDLCHPDGGEFTPTPNKLSPAVKQALEPGLILTLQEMTQDDGKMTVISSGLLKSALSQHLSLKRFKTL